MQVFSHYHIDSTTEIAYRWRTLLQFGNSWGVIGTVFIKHPGTTQPTAVVQDASLQHLLSAFTLSGNNVPWHSFRPCPTMRAIEQLFVERNGGATIEGVIQVFHLSNVCGGERKSVTYDERYAYTTEVDNTLLVAPIYLGWGDVNKEPRLRRAAHSTFLLVQTPAFDQHYLSPYFDKNFFVHPLSLMTTQRYSFESTLFRKSFLENTTKPEGINELLYRHHNDVKNASRSQEILEFLPSFSIAPFANPQRIASNALALNTANGVVIEVHCEDNDFGLHLYLKNADIESRFDFSSLAHSLSWKEDLYTGHRGYFKRTPLEFVGSIYDDIQTIALFLRNHSS